MIPWETRTWHRPRVSEPCHFQPDSCKVPGVSPYILPQGAGFLDSLLTQGGFSAPANWCTGRHGMYLLWHFDPRYWMQHQVYLRPKRSFGNTFAQLWAKSNKLWNSAQSIQSKHHAHTVTGPAFSSQQRQNETVPTQNAGRASPPCCKALPRVSSHLQSASKSGGFAGSTLVPADCTGK